ncbi:MAG: glycosyltransferase family 2 protein [Oscillospiraceae bacterium]
MDNKPLISVVMGVYNIGSRDMLERAVVSVLNQTIDDFEFIICDDASTDKTYKWLCELAKNDKRIRLLRNEKNYTLAITLNRCIYHSHGKYIARQDADDISEPERFEKQIRFLEQNPHISFVGSNCYLYNEREGRFSSRIMPEFPDRNDFMFNSPFIHGSIIFRRECFNSYSYEVSEMTGRYEDYTMFMHMYSDGLRGANIQQNLYGFHYDSEVRNVSMKHRIAEAGIRCKGFSEMNLFPKAVPYVIKPVILGMIPQKTLNSIKHKMNKE